MIIISIARPLGNLKNNKYIDNNKEIVIGLDISSSMKAEDINNFTVSRFEASKNLINNLLEKLKDNISLSIFSDNTIPLTPLTNDYELIKSFLNNIDIKDISGGTNIYLTLSELTKRFDNENKVKIIILITDGENNSDYKFNLPKDINIITIGVGSLEGSKIPEGNNIFGKKEYKTYLGEEIVTKLDDIFLKNLSNNGKYFLLKDADISSLVVDYISSLKSLDIEKELNSRNELFYVFIFASFILLIFNKNLVRIFYLIYNIKIYISSIYKKLFNKIKLI